MGADEFTLMNRGKLSVTPYLSGHDDRFFPSLEITATISRKSIFYLVNVMLPAMMLTLLSFLQHVMPVDLPDERLAITLTLLLSLVGLKYIVTEIVPKLSYFTLIDRYLSLCTSTLFLQAFEGGVAGSLFTG